MAKNTSSRKVPTTVNFTQRQLQLVGKEAGRLGISDGDMIRRIVDEWDERRRGPGLAAKLYQQG